MNRTTIPLFAMLLIGCDGPPPDILSPEVLTTTGAPGIQIGDEGSFGCTVSAVTAVADADATIPELGLSANEAQAGLFGVFSGTGTHYDGTLLDPLTLTMLTPTQVDWVDWVETVAPDGSQSADCPPYLNLSLVVEVDGGATITATVPSQLTLNTTHSLLTGAVDMGQISSTLTPLWVDPTTMDWTDLIVRADFTDGAWQGGMGFMGCMVDGPCSPPVTTTDAELGFSVLP